MKSNGLLDLCALIDYPSLLGLALASTLDKAVESNDLVASDGYASGLISTTVDSVGGTKGLKGMNMDKSVEFSYAELAKATNKFSMAHKIGEGGFGAVYYAKLRGEVCSHTR